MKAKPFDCVAMKRAGSRRVYELTRGMTLAAPGVYASVCSAGASAGRALLVAVYPRSPAPVEEHRVSSSRSRFDLCSRVPAQPPTLYNRPRHTCDDT